MDNYQAAKDLIGDVDVDSMDLSDRLALAQVLASLAMVDEMRKQVTK